MTRFQTLYFLSIFAALIGLAVVGWQNHSLAEQVIRNRESLADCRKIAGEIEIAQEAPELAANTEQATDELTRKTEAWTRQASIEAKQVLRIDPLAPRRVADSDYLLQGAEIELNNLTLLQLASFSSFIVKEDPRLKISRLRISAPRTRNKGLESVNGMKNEVWQAEIALTYLLHSPKSSRSK